MDVIDTAQASAQGILNLDVRVHVSRSEADGHIPSLRNSVEVTTSPISLGDKEKTESSDKTSGLNVRVEKTSGTSSPLYVTPTTAGINTYSGRPDLPAIVNEEIQASKGPVAVVGQWLMIDKHIKPSI